MRRRGGARIPTSKQPGEKSFSRSSSALLLAYQTQKGRKKRGREEKEKRRYSYFGDLNYLGHSRVTGTVWAKSDPDCCVQRAYGAVVPRASREKLIVLYNKLLPYLGKTESL